jgi:peroxidase
MTVTAYEGDLDNEFRRGQDTFHTTLVMQMGQFIDHDITHTPAHTIPCCENYSVSDKSSLDDRCFPIDIPADDPFWKGKKRCMEFTRSLNMPNKKCNLQPRQQVFNFF